MISIRQILFFPLLFIAIPAWAEAPVTHCDIEAAHKFDHQALASAVAYKDIDGERALSACLESVAKFPGSGRLQAYLARVYNKVGEYEKSATHATIAAARGYPFGHYLVAVFYSFGEGFEKDDVQYFRNMKKAAEAGSPIGLVNVGTALRDGEGVEKNIAEAKRWLAMAIDLDVARSHIAMGWIYEKGLDGEINLPKALAAYRRAERLGEDTKKNQTRVNNALASLKTDNYKANQPQNNKPYLSAYNVEKNLDFINNTLISFFFGSPYSHFVDFDKCELVVNIQNSTFAKYPMFDFNDVTPFDEVQNIVKILYADQTHIAIPVSNQAFDAIERDNKKLRLILLTILERGYKLCPSHLNLDDRIDFQKYLRFNGYELEQIDGRFGSETLNAVNKFRQEKNFRDGSGADKFVLGKLKKISDRIASTYATIVIEPDGSVTKEKGLTEDFMAGSIGYTPIDELKFQLDLCTGLYNRSNSNERNKKCIGVIGQHYFGSEKRWAVVAECIYNRDGKRYKRRMWNVAPTRSQVDVWLQNPAEGNDDYASYRNIKCKPLAITAADIITE